MKVIEVQGLHKSYGDVHAVRGIDLHVDAGEVLALLGPNGAGKSTTVEILEGHLERSSGHAEVLGFDPWKGGRELRDRIGIVLQSSGIEEELTVAETIDAYRQVYRRPLAAGEVIELVGLDAKADARIKTLSGGQRRRVDMALGLIGDPELIFLDEPTTGFDPSARRKSWDMLENLTSLGKTILLTTHFMDEAQYLADRVAVIADGVIVAEGTPESLGAERSDAAVISFQLPGSLHESDLPDELRSLASTAGDRLELRSEAVTRTVHALTGWAVARGIELDSLAIDRPSLEDVYLELTGAEHG